jgi:hypothetical protein
MLQAAFLDCQFFYLFPFSDDGFVAPEVDVGRCDVVQALVVALVVIILHEGRDLAFEITGQVIVFQQYSVLHCLMPTLYLALGLRVERGSANVTHFVIIQPFGQIPRDAARPIVAEQARHVPNDRLIAPRRSQGQFDCVSHIFGPHVGAEFPANDIAAVIIQNCAEIKPAPSNDLEVGEVGLSLCLAGHVYMPERSISLMAVVLSVNSSAALITT